MQRTARRTCSVGGRDSVAFRYEELLPPSVSAMSGSRRRIVDDELDEYLEAASASTLAVALKGARAVGKTSTAGERAVTRYDLDDDAQLAVVEADVGHALAQP